MDGVTSGCNRGVAVDSLSVGYCLDSDGMSWAYRWLVGVRVGMISVEEIRSVGTGLAGLLGFLRFVGETRTMVVVVITVGGIDGSDVEDVGSDGTGSASSCGIRGIIDESCVGAFVRAVGAVSASSVEWNGDVLVCMGGAVDVVTSGCMRDVVVGALCMS